MGICCSQDDSIDGHNNGDSSNIMQTNSVKNDSIANAPLLNNEVGRNNSISDSSDIHIYDENNNYNNSNSIPITNPIEKIKLTKTDSMDNECIVCFEKFSKLHPAVIRKCKCGPNTQNYHLACILSWQERSEVCPVCRTKVVLYTE